MAGFADMQFFKIRGEYIIKEFAVVTEDSRMCHFIFKPPPDIQLNSRDLKNIKWLERRYHGLLWKSGSVPFIDSINKIQNSLNSKNGICIVFVKGHQKKEFLKCLGINVHNIEAYGVNYRIKEIKNGVSCIGHKKYANVCALRNAFYLKNQLSLDCNG